MTGFLYQTALYIKNRFKDKYHEICVVLPGKRGRIFLKEHLIKISEGPILLPNIISIEEFTQEVSGMHKMDHLSLSLELFVAWEELMNKNKAEKRENLREFLKWSDNIIFDFNEVDNSLTDAKVLFKNLADIKHIENWSLGKEELSEFQKRYLDFMDKLGDLYYIVSKRLREKGMGWQGLISRKATEKIETSDYISRFNYFIFCGFNALNTCEIKLFQELQKKEKGIFLWDTDNYYLKDSKQEAGEFLRRNFSKHKLKSEGFSSEHLSNDEKNIEIIAAPGIMSQALMVSEKLKSISQNNIEFRSTAVILADESLLQPITKTLPQEVKKVNITLEYPLKQTSLYDLFLVLMQWQSKAEEENKKYISIYHKDFFRFFHNTCIKNLVTIRNQINWNEIINKINKYNVSFISPQWLMKNWPKAFTPISFLFEKWNGTLIALDNLSKLIDGIHKSISQKDKLTDSDKLELEYINGFKAAIIQIKNKSEEYDCIRDVSSLFYLIKEIIGNLSVSFIGEPLTGLQIMGVLESRTLDFENVIISGMNEGKLPASGSNNSFIPYDLKKYFGLTLLKDKDAIYAYNFYRILQRAKNIYLIYNTESDRFGSGEKSRFLTQIETEYRRTNKNVGVKDYIASSTLPSMQENSISIPKNHNSINLIIEKFTKGYGISASSLNSYRTCELKFWYKYVAGVSENEELEEGMEAGTYGIILHKCLESIYKPLEGKTLKTEYFSLNKESLSKIILETYRQFFPEDPNPTGKNFIANNILLIQLQRQIKDDKQNIKNLNELGKNLILNGIEKDLEGKFSMIHDGVEISFKIQGRIDRIDLYGNEVRIIDYKSSISKNNDNFVYQDMVSLFNGGKNTKMIQLFIYAWLAWKNNLGKIEEFLPCIIPFKNYSDEPIYLLDSDKKKLAFTKELLKEFENELKNFLEKILNIDLPFSQTEDIKKCTFCSYKTICNK